MSLPSKAGTCWRKSALGSPKDTLISGTFCQNASTGPNKTGKVPTGATMASKVNHRLATIFLRQDCFSCEPRALGLGNCGTTVSKQADAWKTEQMGATQLKVSNIAFRGYFDQLIS